MFIGKKFDYLTARLKEILAYIEITILIQRRI